MEIFHNVADLPNKYKNSVIAIGNFDGVHLAHREIIKQAKLLAKYYDVKFLILTFEPHPSVKLSKFKDFRTLISLNEKVNILKSLKVDAIIIEKFNRKFSSLKAEEFIKKFLMDKYQAQHIITGYNFRFGYKGEGNSNILARYNKDFKYTQINEITFDGSNISTSKIKELLAKGRIAKAGKLLGKNYNIVGSVVEGKKIASKHLNLPTANLIIDQELFSPLHGVYLAKIKLNDQVYYGIANLGLRPTVNSDDNIILEVNIFDFKENIYNCILEVSLLSLIRPERKFNNLDDLKYQIHLDLIDAKFLVNNLNRHIS